LVDTDQQATVPVPAAITAFAGHLREDTGVEPTIEHLDNRRWKVTVQNDRVRMWVAYDVLSRGRLKWQGSQLFIDGEQVATANGYGHFLDTFRDPDERKPAPAPETEEVDPATAPPAVLGMYRKIHNALAKKGVDGLKLTVRHGGYLWLLVIERPGCVIRMRFVKTYFDPKHPQRPCEVVKSNSRRSLEVEIGGVDLTDQVNGRIDKAMAMMTAHEGAATPPPVSGPAPAAVNTSVNVRKQSVMRI
jgi:hypothetical protein